jgi:hypothetical protein
MKYEGIEIHSDKGTANIRVAFWKQKNERTWLEEVEQFVVTDERTSPPGALVDEAGTPLFLVHHVGKV